MSYIYKVIIARTDYLQSLLYIIISKTKVIRHWILWTACPSSIFSQQKNWIFWQHLFYICCTNLTRVNTIIDRKHDLKQSNQNSKFSEGTLIAYDQVTFQLAIGSCSIYTTSVRCYREHETFSHRLYPEKILIYWYRFWSNLQTPSYRA